MFEHFTERAREVVVLAHEEARTLKHNYIGTEHILARADPSWKRVSRRLVLESLDITVERVRESGSPHHRFGRGGHLRTAAPSPRAPRRSSSWRCARRSASGTTTSAPSTSCLGLVRENGGVAARILLDFDADCRIRDGDPRALRPRRTPRGPGDKLASRRQRARGFRDRRPRSARGSNRSPGISEGRRAAR